MKSAYCDAMIAVEYFDFEADNFIIIGFYDVYCISERAKNCIPRLIPDLILNVVCCVVKYKV